MPRIAGNVPAASMAGAASFWVDRIGPPVSMSGGSGFWSQYYAEAVTSLVALEAGDSGITPVVPAGMGERCNLATFEILQGCNVCVGTAFTNAHVSLSDRLYDKPNIDGGVFCAIRPPFFSTLRGGG